MQSAREGVVARIEFAARVQFGEYELHARDARLFVYVGGHAPAVVLNGGRAVLPQFYAYFVGIAVCGFVYGVIDDFPEDMVQSPHAGGTDVHAGAHAHRLKPFEYF